MKKLENKKIDIREGLATYADLVKGVADYVPRGTGLTVLEMKKRLRLVEAAEKAKESIELEDEDVKKLQEIVPTVEWIFNHKAIVEFTDAVASL